VRPVYVHMKRHTVLLALSALACSDSSAPNQRTPGSFGIRPGLDTAAIGDSVLFVAERADSTVDEWILSDTTLTVLVQHRGSAVVLAGVAGSFTIKARRQGDSGQATLVILPPPATPFAIEPAIDTADIGQWVALVAVGGGVVEWVLSDSSLARFLDPRSLGYGEGAAVVLARAPGTVTVTARRQSDSAQAMLVIPQIDMPADWEAIELPGPSYAINDSGAIVGVLSDYWNATHGGFIYKDGVTRMLPRWGDCDRPEAIGPSGTIAGVGVEQCSGGSRQLLVWDSADARPRSLSGDNDPMIMGVNASGDILTNFGDMLATVRAVMWRNDVPQDLGNLNDSVEKPRTRASAWNSRGQIVGSSNVVQVWANADRHDFFRPFLWEDGVMRDLGVLAPSSCQEGFRITDCSWAVAAGINAHGVVVGTSTDAEGQGRAFIWENGVMRDLGVFPGHWTGALAINDRGQILGTFRNDTAFVWDNGQVQTIVGVKLDVRALSPNGEVIGTIGGWQAPVAFVWQAGQMTTLGAGVPTAINGRSEIIGTRGQLPTLWRKKRG
jgi:probable HAF family extracellular repeat protein